MLCTVFQTIITILVYGILFYPLFDNRPQASWVTCGISLRYHLVSRLINLNKDILR